MILMNDHYSDMGVFNLIPIESFTARIIELYMSKRRTNGGLLCIIQISKLTS